MDDDAIKHLDKLFSKLAHLDLEDEEHGEDDDRNAEREAIVWAIETASMYFPDEFDEAERRNAGREPST